METKNWKVIETERIVLAIAMNYLLINANKKQGNMNYIWCP